MSSESRYNTDPTDVMSIEHNILWETYLVTTNDSSATQLVKII